jgi:glutamine amidotransferase
LVRHGLRAGADPAAVLADTVLAVEAAAPGSRLNLLLTDGSAIWATAWGHSLAVRTTAATGASAASVTVASEPIDPLPGWTEVPDRHLVRAVAGRYRFDALTTVGGEDGSGTTAAGNRIGAR